MQGDIVEQGIELMLYGMGTVVLFLALLVVATGAMSSLVLRYFPEAAPAPGPARPAPPLQAGTPEVEPAVVAAITAALHQHRRRKH